MTGTRKTGARSKSRQAPEKPAAATSPSGALSRPWRDELLALGCEVARLRAAAGLSVAELADRAGLRPAVVRRYENAVPGPVELGDLRDLAAALGTTAGALADAPPRGARPGDAGRGPLVLLPSRLTGTEHFPTVWRLVEYLPRPLGQRWERADQTDPGRVVSRYVTDWSADLLRTPVQVLGSAAELTGQRSWYVGPLRPTAAPTVPTVPTVPTPRGRR